MENLLLGPSHHRPHLTHLAILALSKVSHCRLEFQDGSLCPAGLSFNSWWAFDSLLSLPLIEPSRYISFPLLVHIKYKIYLLVYSSGMSFSLNRENIVLPPPPTAILLSISVVVFLRIVKNFPSQASSSKRPKLEFPSHRNDLVQRHAQATKDRKSKISHNTIPTP
jgi:hypothetical protein